MVQDVLVSRNGRQCVDFGRFHDTLPINDCPSPVRTSGSLSISPEGPRLHPHQV